LGCTTSRWPRGNTLRSTQSLNVKPQNDPGSNTPELGNSRFFCYQGCNPAVGSILPARDGNDSSFSVIRMPAATDSQIFLATSQTVDLFFASSRRTFLASRNPVMVLQSKWTVARRHHEAPLSSTIFVLLPRLWKTPNVGRVFGGNSEPRLETLANFLLSLWEST